MSRNRGTFPFSANFEGNIRGPIDAKMLVSLKSDLIDPSTWINSGLEWTYVGMPVSVSSDPISANNGVYVLNGSDYTNITNWSKLGAGAVWNGLTQTDNSIGLGGTLNLNTTIAATDPFVGLAMNANSVQFNTIDTSGYSYFNINKSPGNNPWTSQWAVGNEKTPGSEIYYDITLATNNKIKFNAYNSGDAAIAYFDEYGFRYSSNYSANWSDRYIPDIAWVNDQITNVNSSLGLYVKKAGDTMTGALVLNSSLYMSGGTNSNIILSNSASLQGRNTTGTVVSLISPWSDNHVYLGADTGFVDFIIRTGTGSIRYRTAGSTIDKMTLTNAGLLGIGQMNPSYNLDVSGNAHITGFVKIDGSVLMANKRISGLAGPIDPSDAMTTYYADASYNIKLWTVDSSVVSLINTGQDVQLSSIQLQENGGVMVLADMMVTYTEPSGTEESYSFNMDGSAVLKIYGVANNASTGVSERSIVALVNYFYMGDPSTNGSWRWFTDASSDLRFEKRVAGVWTFGGKFSA